MMKRKLLFGAGKIGDTAYELFDEGQVAYYVDNNADNVGNIKNGVEIISFEEFIRIHKDCGICGKECCIRCYETVKRCRH